MKDFYKKHRDITWYLLITISVATGVFINATVGTAAVLLIGLHFYIIFADEVDRDFIEFDRLGVSFVALLMHLLGYIVILVAVSTFIDKKEIKIYNSYEVKYLENEKILISKDNDIEIIDDAKLYWECRAKNCKNIAITNINTEPINPIFSKNLPSKSYTKHLVE